MSIHFLRCFPVALVLALLPGTRGMAQEASSTPSSLPEQITKQTPPPPEPPMIEDGGFSIEPLYWFASGQPSLKGGFASTATTYTNVDSLGKSKKVPGVSISIPAGKQNTLRISYFRSQGNANSVAATDLTLFNSTAISAGDYLSASYTIQNAKVSWDFLSYNYHRGTQTFRLKTLWEVQYTTIYSSIDAPFRAVTVDSSGDAISNTAAGTKSFFYPTFGIEVEHAPYKHFRWEAKASGFALPHRADIWDAEATAVLRLGQFEVVAGEKAFHFKTSPKQDLYLSDTLSGAYVGIRYYWGRPE